MGLLRFVVWTVACIALGAFLATQRVEGRTLLEHGQAAWTAHGPSVDEVTNRADGLIDEARKHLAPEARPAEHHSKADRAEIDRLIAKRQQPMK